MSKTVLLFSSTSVNDLLLRDPRTGKQSKFVFFTTKRQICDSPFRSMSQVPHLFCLTFFEIRIKFVARGGFAQLANEYDFGV
jgi:hypothetical protein